MQRNAGVCSAAKHEEDIAYNVVTQVKHSVHSDSSQSPKSSHRRATNTILMLLLFGLQRGLMWRRVLSSRSATIC